MRTVTKTFDVFKFQELSDEAKEKALNDYVNSGDAFPFAQEYIDTLKKALPFYGFSLDDYSVDASSAARSHVSISYASSNGWHDEEDTLRYVRLWKFLKASYGEYYATHRKKYLPVLAGDCPFTGICYDENFLDPIRSFMERPTDITFKELMEDCVNSLLFAMQEDYEYQVSEDGFNEHCEGNDYEFLEDGTFYIE